MIRYLNRSIVIGALLVAAVVAAPAQERIATVDLRKVFEDYWKTKQANAALKERGGELEKEIKSMLADLETAREDYRKLLESANDQAVSATERDRRRKAADDRLKDLRDKEQQIQQFERQARTTIDEQQRRMRDNILEEVKAAITIRAKTGNFTFVIDVAAETANRTPVVLYNSSPNDLTEAVLSQLNATAPLDLERTNPPAGQKR